jgi:hypothetical protein
MCVTDADFQAERLSQLKEPRVVNLCVSVQSAITDSVIESHLRVVRLQDNHACVACGVEQHPRNLIAEPESHSTQLLYEEFLYAQSHRIHVCGRVIVFWSSALNHQKGESASSHSRFREQHEISNCHIFEPATPTPRMLT